MKLFMRQISTWIGETVYRKEKRELNKQINKLITLQSVLGQTNQGTPENEEVKKKQKMNVNY